MEAGSVRVKNNTFLLVRLFFCLFLYYKSCTGHCKIPDAQPNLTSILKGFICREERQKIIEQLDDPATSTSIPQKTLVVILSSTRGRHVTWMNFKTNVLDALDADLALAVTRNSSSYDCTQSDTYREAANYLWEIEEPEGHDFTALYHEVSKGCFKHKFDDYYASQIGQVNYKNSGWLGCLKASKQRACSGQIIYMRYVALQHILNLELYRKYDRVMITRSDFLWLAPQPKDLPIKPGEIWIPRTEDYGGVYDRHYMMTMRDAINTLDLLDATMMYPNPHDQKKWLVSNNFNNGKGNLEWAHYNWHIHIRNMTEQRYPLTGLLVQDYNEHKQLKVYYSNQFTIRVGSMIVIARYKAEFEAVRQQGLAKLS